MYFIWTAYCLLWTLSRQHDCKKVRYVGQMQMDWLGDRDRNRMNHNQIASPTLQKTPFTSSTTHRNLYKEKKKRNTTILVFFNRSKKASCCFFCSCTSPRPDPYLEQVWLFLTCRWHYIIPQSPDHASASFQSVWGCWFITSASSSLLLTPQEKRIVSTPKMCITSRHVIGVNPYVETK